jgi:UPF0716 protein FxsA
MFCLKGKDMWLLIIFLAIPIVEIVLFVQIGGQIGVIGTLAEIAITSALGLVLMRLEPHRNAQDVRAALARDASPASPMAHSALRLIGAALLFVPGFFTDALGLLLLLPPLRMLILARLFKTLQTAARRGDTVIIEGEYETRPTQPPGADYPRLPDRENRD